MTDAPPVTEYPPNEVVVPSLSPAIPHIMTSDSKPGGVPVPTFIKLNASPLILYKIPPLICVPVKVKLEAATSPESAVFEKTLLLV